MTKPNTNAIEFRIIADNMNKAETVLISMKELNVDPRYQMREEMDHDNIALYAESLADLPPVHVMQVGERLILTDGFHRFFAHELAEAADIQAKVVEGTAKEAMAYAMAANFVHLKGGSKPTKGDQKRAILRMCEVLEEKIGYDAKSTVSMLGDYGITCSVDWKTKCSKNFRESLTLKRDAKIMELHEAGESQRTITKTVGCTQDTVGRVIRDERKQDSREIVQEEDTKPPHDFHDETTDADENDAPWNQGFSDEELEEAPIVNPMDAMTKTLEDFDNTLQQDKADTTIPSSSSVIPANDTRITKGTNQDDAKAQLRAAIRATGIYENFTQAEVNKMIFEISQGN